MIEIMSPVGSFESLQAAIQGGADAVYFGVGKLNMRSRSAANFTVDDLPRIVEICKHSPSFSSSDCVSRPLPSGGVPQLRSATLWSQGRGGFHPLKQSSHQAIKQSPLRTYLTVNTIIYNDEIDEMHALLHAAKEAGISAIIASDMAVITFANQIGLEVHISTQCNVSNTEAVRYYARFADVIVTARELPLRQVAEITQFIRDNDIRGPKGELLQVEVFAHGALCMSVSGKCYLSLDNYNFSANRGACLQPCRRGYIVKDKESDLELEIDNEYIMSPKDLCTIGFLDKILRAGVRVLKIEGRGRSADYVRTVTECYREAVEAIEAGTYTQEKIDRWMQRLATVFNRGFWDGYYLGRRLGEWSERYGSQATENKVYLGPVKNYFGRISVAEVQLQTSETLRVGDEVMVTGDTTGVYRATIHELRTDRDPVPEVHQGDSFSFATTEPLHRGDKVYRIDKVRDDF